MLFVEALTGGRPNIGFWDRPQDSVAWGIVVVKPGRYRVEIEAGGPNASRLVVEVEGKELAGGTPATGSWDEPRVVKFGELEITAAGIRDVVARPENPWSWKAINLWTVRLTLVR